MNRSSRAGAPARMTSAFLLAGALAGCGPRAYEQAQARDLAAVEARLAPPGDRAADPDAPRLDGSFDAYLTHALRRHPGLRAAYEAWRAQALRVEPARRWPEPMLRYGYAVNHVERHRVGVRQGIPWPAALDAGADAAAAMARAARAGHDAAALAIQERVAGAFWQLWLLQRTREVQAEQRQILSAMAASVRARVEVGRASLADLGQIDLAVSRIDDALRGLELAERAAAARLLAAVGAAQDTPAPVAATPPPGGLPAEDEHALRRAAAAHPRLRAFDLRAEAENARAARAVTDGYPDLAVDLEYMRMYPPPQPGAAEGGEDAIMAMLSVSLPVWRDAYRDTAEAARAQGASYRAEGRAARDRAVAELVQVLTRIRDAHRRIGLYERTMIPQAEAVYGSVVGSYETDRAPVTSVLLAQRELLELRLALAQARRDHAVAWAALEHLVGHPVETATGEEAP